MKTTLGRAEVKHFTSENAVAPGSWCSPGLVSAYRPRGRPVVEFDKSETGLIQPQVGDAAWVWAEGRTRALARERCISQSASSTGNGFPHGARGSSTRPSRQVTTTILARSHPPERSLRFVAENLYKHRP